MRFSTSADSRPSATTQPLRVDESLLASPSVQPGRARDISDLVRHTLSKVGFEPPILPEVALRLTHIASQPDVDMREVQAAVIQDPVVAARIVSVANSALYNRGTAVNSLRMAISRLGLALVRDVAFQVVAQTKIFRVPGYMQRARSLADTAHASGFISREICKILQFESELAYLCGLCHDMGEPILLGIVADATRAQRKPLPALEDIALSINSFHAPTGAGIATLWRLPDIIVDAILNHHSPERSTHPSQMALVVACSDVLLAHAGIGCSRTPIKPLDCPLFYRLNLTPIQVESLLGLAESMAADRTFWSAPS